MVLRQIVNDFEKTKQQPETEKGFDKFFTYILIAIQFLKEIITSIICHISMAVTVNIIHNFSKYTYHKFSLFCILYPQIKPLVYHYCTVTVMHNFTLILHQAINLHAFC